MKIEVKGNALNITWGDYEFVFHGKPLPDAPVGDAEEPTPPPAEPDAAPALKSLRPPLATKWCLEKDATPEMCFIAFIDGSQRHFDSIYVTGAMLMKSMAYQPGQHVLYRHKGSVQVAPNTEIDLSIGCSFETRAVGQPAAPPAEPEQEPEPYQPPEPVDMAELDDPPRKKIPRRRKQE